MRSTRRSRQGTAKAGTWSARITRASPIMTTAASTCRWPTPSGSTPLVSSPHRCGGFPYYNALAEPVIGLYKTELIKARRPLARLRRRRDRKRRMDHRYNHRRFFDYCDDLTPVEAETAHYAHHQPQQQPEPSNQYVSGHTGAVHAW